MSPRRKKKVRAAVVLRRAGPVPLEPLAELFSRLREVPFEEAVHAIVRNGGLLLRDASPDEAEQFGKILRKMNIPYTLMPADGLPELSTVKRLRRLSVKKEQIEYETTDGEQVTIKRDELLLASLTILSGEDAETPRYVLTLYRKEPFVGYRLSADVADSRRPSANAEMLRTAVVALHESYPRSALNKGIRQLARFGFKGTPQKHLTFRRLNYLESYELWLAYIRYYDINFITGTKRGQRISALGRVRFSLRRKEIGAEQEKEVETKAMESRSRRLKAVEFIPPQKRAAASRRLPDISAVDFLAPLLEETALLKIALIIAFVCLLVWLFVYSLS